MNTLRFLAAATVAAGLLAAPANATTFKFKTGGAGTTDYDTSSNWAQDCGTIGVDYCTVDDGAGFVYSNDGISVTVTALSGGEPTQLIQDVFPTNSGLGAYSEGEFDDDDQVQTAAGEALQFVFDTAVWLTNIEFNSGADRDCSAATQPEGPCGDFQLTIDDMVIGTYAAEDLVTMSWYGTKFLFEAVSEGAGFVIAQFEVSEVPVPAALPLLISGLAGLGFASRRRKTA